MKRTLETQRGQMDEAVAQNEAEQAELTRLLSDEVSRGQSVSEASSLLNAAFRSEQTLRAAGATRAQFNALSPEQKVLFFRNPSEFGEAGLHLQKQMGVAFDHLSPVASSGDVSPKKFEGLVSKILGYGDADLKRTLGTQRGQLDAAMEMGAKSGQPLRAPRVAPSTPSTSSSAPEVKPVEVPAPAPEPATPTFSKDTYANAPIEKRKGILEEWVMHSPEAAADVGLAPGELADLDHGLPNAKAAAKTRLDALLTDMAQKPAEELPPSFR